MFPAGIASVSFDVNITADNLVEVDENFYLTIDPFSLLTCVTIGSLHQTTITIADKNSKLIQH